MIIGGLELFRAFLLLALAGFFQCDRNCLFLRLARPHFRFDVRTDRFVRRAFLERHVLRHFEIVLSFEVTFARVKGSRYDP